MDIGGLSGPSGIGGRPTPGQPGNPPSETSERSLVPLTGSPRESNPGRPARPSSAFLAQLIATAQHAPQTRARSRAEPADAIASYNGGASISAPPRTWEQSV